MIDNAGLKDVRKLAGVLVLALALIQGEGGVRVELAHVKAPVAVLIDAAAVLAGEAGCGGGSYA